MNSSTSRPMLKPFIIITIWKMRTTLILFTASFLPFFRVLTLVQNLVVFLRIQRMPLRLPMLYVLFHVLFNEQLSTPHYQRISEFEFVFLPTVVSVDIEKPQITFKPGVNNSKGVFKPHLQKKHNAKKEWDSSYFDINHNMFLMEDYARQIGMDIRNNGIRSHINPYSYEINRMMSFYQLLSQQISFFQISKTSVLSQ